jgi:hypothetical protein
MMIDLLTALAGDILSPLGVNANSPLEDICAEQKAGRA